jgi:hypothetical protein
MIMSNTPGTPGYAATSSFPATPGSPGASTAQITSSQSLANTLKSNFTRILNDYESLTSQLFASIVETAEGRRAERSPASLMREIVDLDKKLQDGVSQSKSCNINEKRGVGTITMLCKNWSIQQGRQLIFHYD